VTASLLRVATVVVAATLAFVAVVQLAP